VNITHNKGDTYHVTGVDIDGKRFKIVTSSPIQALGINLWRGTVWQLKAGSEKRKLIKKVWNL